MQHLFEGIKGSIEQQQYAKAVKELEKINIQKLTRAQLGEADSLLSMLPRETLCASVELCYSMFHIKKQKGDMTAAAKWHDALAGMREPGRNNPYLENRIFCAGLCMPQGPRFNLLLSLAVLAHEFGDVKFPPARLSVTAKIPSVLRGAMDFSDLGKHCNATAGIVKPLLPMLLEDNANGVCEAAVAEILYERGDLNGASLQAAGAISADNPEIAFAGLALLARLGAVDTAAKPPAEILNHIGEMLEKKEAYWLMPNYKALCARFDILRGDTEKIRDWISGCELNDFDGYALQNAYELITKAKAYIALAEYRNAATLLESLTLSMQKEGRILDTVECLANGAVVCELLGSGDLAVSKLEQALLLAQEYGYVRVFADLGKQMFHLIARYSKEADPHEGINVNYIKKITEAAKIYSMLHPSLYNAANGKENGAEEPAGGGLTQSEVHILQLLDSGKTNKAIAKELSIQPTTVSFHLSNVFEKMGVTNRMEAVKAAREMGILS
ncbi:MAG: LuxR C-terminal-related transcriptional regulator [Oscillospiraceae bacterium]|nr:LuxR C-terminal-related transcriptional regulator [Oscillospiraceae bacterium]